MNALRLDITTLTPGGAPAVLGRVAMRSALAS